MPTVVCYQLWDLLLYMLYHQQCNKVTISLSIHTWAAETTINCCITSWALSRTCQRDRQQQSMTQTMHKTRQKKIDMYAWGSIPFCLMHRYTVACRFNIYCRQHNCTGIGLLTMPIEYKHIFSSNQQLGYTNNYLHQLKAIKVKESLCITCYRLLYVACKIVHVHVAVHCEHAS